MVAIEFDETRRRVTAAPWSARVISMSSKPHPVDEIEAVISIAPRVNLSIRAQPGATDAYVALWAGEVDESDGLAVAIADNRLSGVQRIPMCGCGDRGCGNAGLQLAAYVAAADLPVLIDAVVGLPMISGRPQRSTVWKGAIGPDGPII